MFLGINLLLRIFSLLLGSVLIMLFAGCSSSSDGAVLPEFQEDTIEPGVRSVLPPDLSDSLVITNSELRLMFNELIDESSLTEAVKLVSFKGRDLTKTTLLGSSNISAYEIDERTISLDLDDYLYTSTVTEVIREYVDEDGAPQTEVRQVTEEVPASILRVTPENGRLALWSLYSLELGAAIRDRSPVNSISPVDGEPSIGNYLAPYSVQFGTEDGAWRSSREVNSLFFLDSYTVPEFDYVSTGRVGATIWIQQASVPSVFSHLYFRGFDQSSQAFNEEPQRVDFIASIDGAAVSSEFVKDFAVDAVNDDHCFTWSTEDAGIISLYLRCRNEDGYQSRLLLASHSAIHPISSLQLELTDNGSGFVSYIYNGQYFVYAFDGSRLSQLIVVDSIVSDAAVEVLELVIDAMTVESTARLNAAVVILNPGLPVDSGHRLEHHTLEVVSGSFSRNSILVSEGSVPAEKLSFGVDYLGRGLIGWSEGAGKNRNYYTSVFDTVNWLTRVPVSKNGEATILEGAMFMFADGQAIFAWIQEYNGDYEVKVQGVFPAGPGNAFTRPRVLTLVSAQRTIQNIKVVGDREGNAFVYFNEGPRASSFRFRQNIEWGSAWGALEDLGLVSQGIVMRALAEDGRMALMTTEQVSDYEVLKLNVFSDFD